MIYRQDKNKNKHLYKIYFLVFFLLVIFTPVGKFFRNISASIFEKSFGVKVWAQEIVYDLGLETMSKSELIEKVKTQQSEIDRLLVIENLYNEMKLDYENLSQFLGVKEEFPNLVLAEVLSSPSQSVYDTLIVKGSFPEGSVVFSQSGIPVGTVDKNLGNNSNILFYSHSGRETEGFLGEADTPITLVGKGSGNFVISLPREVEITEGEKIYLPGIKNSIGRVGFVEFDPRDPFQKVFVLSEENIYKLEYVLVQNEI